MKLKVAAAIAALALSACSTTGADRGGSATQAFADAAGTRPHGGAAIVEAMAGGLVAGPVGAGLDTRDRRRALEAEYRALEHTPAGQKVAWGRAGDRGGHGEVVAGSPYRVGSQNCRQYAHTVSVGGRAQTARGAACRNPDGSWTPLA